MIMSEKHEDQLGGLLPVGRGMFGSELRMPPSVAKAKSRRHERRKVREVLHQIVVEEDIFD